MVLDAGAATWANIGAAAANCVIDIQTKTSISLEIFLNEDRCAIFSVCCSEFCKIIVSSVFYTFYLLS